MPEDLDRLQGSWTLAALEMDGQKMPASMLANARIVIQGRRFTSTGMGAMYEGAVELDASHTPGHIDMKFDAGPESGNTNLGIYALEGDNLKICLATRGSLRPSSFASSSGSGFALETFTRESAPVARRGNVRSPKTAATATPNRTPATELEGEWSMVSGILDGRPMDESLVKWVKRVTQGNQTTVYAGPQVMLQAEFTHDPSKSPKTIDYINTAGSNKGKIQHGIYAFEGDLLRIYMSAPGVARPAKFNLKPGKEGTLTVWKKA